MYSKHKDTDIGIFYKIVVKQTTSTKVIKSLNHTLGKRKNKKNNNKIN